MQNNDHTQKIVLGALVGGLIGGGVLFFINRNADKPAFNKLGKAISDLGEILEESSVDNRDDALDEIEKTIPKGDHTINHVLNWVATGISLWKNIKKGM